MKPLNKKYIIAIVKRVLKYYKGTLCVTISILGVFCLLMWGGSMLLKYKIALPDYLLSAFVVFLVGIVFVNSMSNGILSIVADSEKEKEKKASVCENLINNEPRQESGAGNATSTPSCASVPSARRELVKHPDHSDIQHTSKSDVHFGFSSCIVAGAELEQHQAEGSHRCGSMGSSQLTDFSKRFFHYTLTVGIHRPNRLTKRSFAL